MARWFERFENRRTTIERIAPIDSSLRVLLTEWLKVKKVQVPNEYIGPKRETLVEKALSNQPMTEIKQRTANLLRTEAAQCLKKPDPLKSVIQNICNHATEDRINEILKKCTEDNEKIKGLFAEVKAENKAKKDIKIAIKENNSACAARILREKFPKEWKKKAKSLIKEATKEKEIEEAGFEFNFNRDQTSPTSSLQDIEQEIRKLNGAANQLSRRGGFCGHETDSKSAPGKPQDTDHTM